jgi:imidazolonepropionase-like amidohydrolase
MPPIIRSAARAAAAMLLTAACVAGGQSAPTAAAASRPLIIRHANVIDGVADTVLRDATVFIRGNRIERIARGAVDIPADAQVVDAAGGYLLPGLIDAHAHIETLAGARRALESGVTTFRSASVSGYQDVALRELARSGAIDGPDVLAAGLYVTPDLSETILADPRLAPLAGGVTTPEQLRLLVRINLDHGVDVIKTRGTARAGLPDTDPRQQVYTEEQLRVVVEEAAKRGVPVMAHAHGDEGARAAVLAGVRSVEHGTYLSDSTLHLMKARGTFFVPTISTMEALFTDDNAVLRLRGPHMVPRLKNAVRRAHALGIPIVTGTDNDYAPNRTERIAEEVGRLADAGLTPMEAIRAATTVAAQLLRIEDHTGAVRVGLEADLIVVPDNPLDDLRTLQDVLVVVSNGRVALNRLPFGRTPGSATPRARP